MTLIMFYLNNKDLQKVKESGKLYQSLSLFS
jgi:hypothetical protein